MMPRSSAKPWTACSGTRRIDTTWGCEGGGSWSRSSIGGFTCPGSGSSPRRSARRPDLQPGLTTSEHVLRHRPSAEGEPLPVDEGPVPRRRECVDAVPMRTAPKRRDERSPYFHILGRREPHDTVL